MKKLIALTVTLALAPLLTFAQSSQLNDINDVVKTGTAIGNTVIAVIIAIAVIYIIYGVFKYLIKGATSEEDRKAGRQTIIYGVIGLFVILSIWGLVGILSGSFKFGNKNAPTDEFPKVNVRPVTGN